MDFMRLIKSIEELLFEVVAWLLFYPITLWRAVRQPIRMMVYAETELNDAVDEQYVDALSPPIFLLLSLVLLHAIELLMPPRTAAMIAGYFGDDRNLLLFRAVTFSAFPLLFGLVTIRLRGARLTRATLRPAFYAQCYLTAPYVLAMDLALMVLQQASNANVQALGIATLVIATVLYLAVQTAWLARSDRVGRWRAFGAAMGTTLAAFLIVLAVGVAVSLSILARQGAAA